MSLMGVRLSALSSPANPTLHCKPQTYIDWWPCSCAAVLWSLVRMGKATAVRGTRLSIRESGNDVSQLRSPVQYDTDAFFSAPSG